MRHRRSGKKLNRNASHRRSMVRNMATSLILSASDNAEGSVLSGKIVTTIDKAKFLRPEIERLVTMAKKATVILENAPQVPSKDSPEWSSWRNSEQWQTWANTVAPAVSLRRRAFAILRSKEAV
ncbi:MAG: 50S ribosomal protein L17, partial [Planctomycetes bacterium]|nr:50S ribosomal protein L17 [Planctomycetota bacterium]